MDLIIGNNSNINVGKNDFEAYFNSYIRKSKI